MGLLFPAFFYPLFFSSFSLDVFLILQFPTNALLGCEHVPFTLSSSPSNSSFVLSNPSRICPFTSLVFSSKFYTHQHVLCWNRAARDPAWGHDRDRRAYCEGQHSRILRARSRSLAGLGPTIAHEATLAEVSTLVGAGFGAVLRSRISRDHDRGWLYFFFALFFIFSSFLLHFPLSTFS